MSATITAPTAQLSVPSGQPIVYKLTTSTTPWTDDHRFIVQVLEDTVEIGKYYIARNPADVAFFDLNQIAQPRLSRPIVDNSDGFLHTSTGGDALSKSWGGILQYTVRVGEWDGSAESLNQDSESVYVYDGVVWPKPMSISTGQVYTPSTLLPTFQTCYVGEIINSTHVVKLSMRDSQYLMSAFLNTTNSLATLIKYTITDGTTTNTVDVALTDGSVLPASQSSSPEAQVYIPVGPRNIDARTGLTWINDWTQITITPYNSTTSLATSIEISRVCENQKHTEAQVLFANDVGGYDTLVFDHATQVTSERSDKAYRPLLKKLNGSSYSYAAYEAYDTPYVVEHKQKLSLAGYFAIADNVAIENMLRSRRIFVTQPGSTNSFVPASILTKSVKVRPELQSRMYQVSMDLALSVEPVC